MAKGWRPGAITRRLLRKLNQAKLRRNAAEDSKYPLKKAKKRPDNKPTLMICKVKGEYIVEMQVTGENSEGTVEQYNPLVYRIAKTNNEEKVAKLERKRRRLVREAVGDVLRDAYRPDVCERTCLRAYKQAVGLLPFDPNNPECICDEEDAPAPEPSPSCSCGDDDISSDCSSMDIDWEIHFTPPYHSNS